MIAQLNIPGFNITKVLQQTKEKVLVKAIDIEKQKAVLLKILLGGTDKPIRYARLRRELDLVGRFNLLSAVQPKEIIEADNLLVSIMEDFGGKSLTEYSVKYPLVIPDFLKISKEIVLAVSQLHQHGINHTRLHPGNILINPENLEIKLLDLETASLLNNESAEPINMEHIDVGLAYLAPEQSGRMNRQIDSRSNLYSLGCIFYEMLTGQQVFNTDNFVELVYAHMAKPPTPLSEVKPNIPPVLNGIVLKLLNKNAEDRYQSSIGLLKDIETCQQNWESKNALDSFPIAQHDISKKLRFPQKLYGRSSEIQLLLEIFEEVQNGGFKILMLGGYSGIGKTALVHEARKSMIAKGGLFISGKYDQLKKDIAYSALLNAFRQFIQQRLSASNKLTQEFIANLKTSLRGQEQLIIEVLPELELLIGKQKKLPVLPVEEAQNRFLDALCLFVGCFASKAHPLVLFIDDLQWADLSTLKFFTKISQFINNEYIQIIGAYRDNEVSAMHPLMMTMQEIEKLGIHINHLSLKALSSEDVNLFISDTLRQDPESTLELSQIIGRQTGSNPFFLKLFVTRLIEDELIFFNSNTFKWEWDIKKIKEAGITDNVVELLMQNLGRLPQECQDILKYASCLGNRFDLLSLNIITEFPASKIAKTLWTPLSQQFIIPLDDWYKLAETIKKEVLQDSQYKINVNYQFAHDRAQQAAYNLLEEEERLKIHYKIAQKLYDSLYKRDLGSQLFNIVNHFNIALPLVKGKENLEKIRELNLLAGDKANKATSFNTALHFYQMAASLYIESDWENDNDSMVQVHIKLAECAYICGEYEFADNLYALLLNKAEKQSDIAMVYDIQLRQYAQQGRNIETLQRGVDILRKYGVSFIAEPNLIQLLPKLIYTKLLLWGKDVSKFSELPPVNSPKIAFAIQTLMNISATAYVYNANTMLLLVLRMVQLSVKHGNAPESAFGYGLFGFVEGAALGNAQESKKFADLSIKLSQNIEDPIIRAKVKFLRAFSTQHWFEPIPKALPELLEAFKMLDNSGSYTFAGYCLQALMAKRLYLGEALPNYLDDVFEYSQYADRIQENYTQNLLLVLRFYVCGISGIEYEQIQDHELMVREDAYLQELKEKRLLMPVAWHYVYKQMLHYQLGDYETSLEYSKKARIVDDAAPTTMAQIEHHFYNALLLTENYNKESFPKKYLTKLRIIRELSKLKNWAKDCPENFELRYQIARANWEATSNQFSNTESFNQIIQVANDGPNLQLKAFAFELAAKHLFAYGSIKMAVEKLNTAIQHYEVWGAMKKVEQLKQKYIPDNQAFKSETSSLGELIDVEAILKASQVISGDLVLEKLLSNLLSILMENAGAQRGFLILNRDVLRIEAEHNSDQEKPIVLQSEPVSKTNKVSTAIVNYVWRTGEYVLLDDAQSPNNFSTDSYLDNSKVRSVLCIPIKNQGKTSSIIYLENNLSSKVFTESRLNMTTTLASQAAISLENSMLYNSLEQKVEDRTLELVNEKKKTDELLLNILPVEIAEELKNKGEASTHVYDKATILFADFQNFTQVVEYVDPEDLVKLLDLYFSQFDGIMQKYGIEKIKTVGDAYIAAGGLPDPRKGKPETVVRAAIDMQKFAEKIASENKAQKLPYFEARIGIHTGPVIAGVVGRLKFAYDIWGDTVNIAARLEQNGEAGKINISGATHREIKSYFDCSYRGKIEAKNKGQIDMYFVNYE